MPMLTNLQKQGYKRRFQTLPHRPSSDCKTASESVYNSETWTRLVEYIIYTWHQANTGSLVWKECFVVEVLSFEHTSLVSGIGVFFVSILGWYWYQSATSKTFIPIWSWYWVQELLLKISYPYMSWYWVQEVLNPKP
jgi:hypothetical protein